MHCKKNRYFIVIIISEIKMFEEINSISNIMQKKRKMYSQVTLEVTLEKG